MSDWSYEQPLEVVSDPDQAEVDRLLQELFPRTNGGVQNHFYSDPNMPPVPQMPELHPDAEIVLDFLDGAYLPARAAAALQERRARREEKAQEEARLEAEEARRSEAQKRIEEVIKRERDALRTAKARKKAEAEEARKAAQAERQQRAKKDEEARKAAQAEQRQQRARKAEEERKAAQAEQRQRADEVVRAAAEADRERIANEEARRKDQRRLAAEATRQWQAAAAADAERKGVEGRHDPAFPDTVAGRAPHEVVTRGRSSGRPDRVDEHPLNASKTAAAGSPPQAKAWSAPVVVPAPIQAPEEPSPASAAGAAAAESVSRSEARGGQHRADNVVQFPGPKRSSPGAGALQPDAGAAQPKRRGRPPGSKNKVRPPPSHSATAAPEARPSTTPVLRTTDAVSPAPALRPLRRLSSSAYPLLTASFPLPSWRSINALRDSWSRSLPYDTDVLEQARSALPSDCIRWRVRNGEVSFSEIVASVMTAGGQGARLLLFHDVHLGVAAIDVRCPRPQMVERWSRCIDAAKASLPAGCEMPPHAVMDRVQRLRVDLTVSTLVECLWEIGLGVAVGPVET